RPAARTRSANPIRRNISIVRALHRSILGRKAGSLFCSRRTHRMPRQPRSSASVNPTGPAPTMMTCVCIAPVPSEAGPKRRTGPGSHLLYRYVRRQLDQGETAASLVTLECAEVGDDEIDDRGTGERQRATAHDFGLALLVGVFHQHYDPPDTG